MTNCYHCGDECQNELIKSDEKVFCCNGCKTVFELLSEHSMASYYDMESAPGLKVNGIADSHKFAYLDQEAISAKFLQFNDGRTAKVSFFIPQIHCSSCIWLLENLNQLHSAFTHSHVMFSKRTLDLSYKPDEISLSELVGLLASIGYEPDLSENTKNRKSTTNQHLLLQIGVAGFAFGNIMLLSFPEYLGIDRSFQEFRAFFGYISLFLALPAFFFSGSDYLKQAFRGIKQRFINMDIPIAIGMCVLLVRSAYEIISQTGAGYLDSLAGLIFFLLLGKWFQRKSYDALSFERDYKSYFPIAVNRLTENKTEIVEIENLNVADRIVLRNQELIPADGILDSDEDLLLNEGYVEVGMDHFALPTDKLAIALKQESLHRNYMGYTTNDTKIMIGLGMSAISDVWGAFGQNLKSLNAYQDAANSKTIPVFRGHEHSQEDLELRQIILDIICYFEATWSTEFEDTPHFTQIKKQLVPLINHGLCVLQPGSIEVTKQGEPFVRNICMCFDAHLKEDQIKRFSKTI